jgi:hypothetical protein
MLKKEEREKDRTNELNRSRQKVGEKVENASTTARVQLPDFDVK